MEMFLRTCVKPLCRCPAFRLRVQKYNRLTARSKFFANFFHCYLAKVFYLVGFQSFLFLSKFNEYQLLRWADCIFNKNWLTDCRLLCDRKQVQKAFYKVFVGWYLFFMGMNLTFHGREHNFSWPWKIDEIGCRNQTYTVVSRFRLTTVSLIHNIGWPRLSIFLIIVDLVLR